MNLKEKWKRFWTLDVHNHEGFTLVELIIVIAILAILSTGAIAGYSAYIKKANEAADKQLLAELNTAFTIACIEENVDINLIGSDDVQVDIDKDAHVIGITFNRRVKNKFDANDTFSNTFMKCFDNNKNVALKVYTSAGNIVFNPEVRAFVFVEGEFITIQVGNYFITYKVSDIAKFKDSAFGQMGSSLLTNVDNVVTWAEDYLGGDGLVGQIQGDDDFQKFCTDVMGVPFTEMTPRQKTNALVLYSAQKTPLIDTNTLLNMGGFGNPDVMVGDNQDDMGAVIAAQAMQFALGLAYYRELNGNDPDDQNDVWGVMATPGYADWVATNGQTTIDGYTSAMDIINGNLDYIDAGELLEDGFSSDTLSDILDQILG